MYLEYTCLECGKKFEVNKDSIERCKNSIGTRCKKHIRDEHKLTIKDYIIKHYYNGIEPTCECGCGKYVTFNPKNCFWSDRHGFNKYFHCSHKKANNREQGWVFDTVSYKSKWENENWVKEHYDKLYGLKNIESAANEFLTNNDITLVDISQKYNIDKRTIKGIWFKLNIVTEEQYNERIKFNQINVSSKHRKVVFENYEIICERLYNILKQFPGKFTLHRLIQYFNETNLLQIEQDQYIVLNKLIELYGNDIYDLMQYGYHSKEEVDFINVLKFYFGKSKIKVGKKIHYGTDKTRFYVYDCCIDNKILIEYDGGGFWHSTESTKVRDVEKENIAIQNNYKILRVSDKSSKDPELIIKIKNILNYD